MQNLRCELFQGVSEDVFLRMESCFSTPNIKKSGERRMPAVELKVMSTYGVIAH